MIIVVIILYVLHCIIIQFCIILKAEKINILQFIQLFYFQTPCKFKIFHKNKTAKIVIIVEAEWWAHGGSLTYSTFIYVKFFHNKKFNACTFINNAIITIFLHIFWLVINSQRKFSNEHLWNEVTDISQVPAIYVHCFPKWLYQIFHQLTKEWFSLSTPQH